jgi:hypothetical protein
VQLPSAEGPLVLPVLQQYLHCLHLCLANQRLPLLAAPSGAGAAAMVAQGQTVPMDHSPPAMAVQVQAVLTNLRNHR